MTQASRSDQRFSFQRTQYLAQCQERDQIPDQDYLDYFDQMIEQHRDKWHDPKSRLNNLEYDLVTTDWILQKTRASKWYAQNLYAAMCNNTFVKKDVWPILQNQTWHCSWRYAGGIVADMRAEGDYIDWYCSGIRDSEPPGTEEWANWTAEHQHDYTENFSRYVQESVITDEIQQDLNRLGWMAQPVPE